MFKEQENLYEVRIDRFVDRLSQLVYKDWNELHGSYFLHEEETVNYEDRLEVEPEPINIGDEWGNNFQRAWFHIEGNIPAELRNEKIYALVNLGSEGLVYTNQGIPYQSISIHTIWDLEEFKREVIPINDQLIKNGKIDFWIEATAGQLFGLKLQVDNGNRKPERFGQYNASLNKLNLATCNQELKHIYYDFWTLNQLMKALPEEDVRRKRILYSLHTAINAYESSEKNLETVKSILARELSKRSSESSLKTTAVGHAHLDTAWLWPQDETIRKCARTFSNQIRNCEKYNAFIFGASSAQHYAFVKQYYPQLYQQIKKKVEQGKWEIQGGMWVEADCNLISGESLIRQILYGKLFFQEEFGIDVNYLWLPDVFGYSAAMPQIIKKSGMDYFVTQKLSWNQFNKFPHNTFRWEGLDGTEVITHFPPEDDYNSTLDPEGLKKSQQNFSENYFLDEYLTLFGIGDGGGGPTEKIIETGLRCQDLEGLPQIKFNKAGNFLKKLATHKDQLHKWTGELYLELHRGTFTTHAYNKKMNRLLENEMRELEILYSVGARQKYPSNKLDKMWKQLLKNQFHDIIPGSSITPVYEDCRKEYRELSKTAEKLKNNFAHKVFEKDNNKMSFVNSLSFKYSNYHVLPQDWNDYEVLDENGNQVDTQLENENLIINLGIPALATKVLKKGKKINRTQEKYNTKELVLENELIRYKLNARGQIVRAFDKGTQREIINQEQPGNNLKLYEDRPVNWDAWDIDIFYEECFQENAKLEETNIIAKGKVRSGLRFKLKVGNSKIKQEVYLSRNSKRLDFQTEIDWQEDHKLLRVHFPVNINADYASYDIQYGNVKRPTHRNSSRDMAKFEVIGHKYADLSENNYGVALLNNCKYGYKVYQNDISLSLLRAPTSPDPYADRGEHKFTYSLYPHKNNLINSKVVAEAYQLNSRASQFNGFDLNKFSIPFHLTNEEIILEVIKQCEYDDNLILRLYEPYGKRSETTLSFRYNNITNVYETDMMEKIVSTLKCIDNKVQLSFSPFEIKTLKIDFEE